MFAVGVQDADVFNGPEEVLVDAADRKGQVVPELLFGADRDFPHAHRAHVGVGGIKGRSTEIEGAGGVPGVELPSGEIAVSADFVPLVGVKRIIDALPLETAVRAGRHLELHDIVEPPQRSEELQAGIAVDVIDKPQARGHFLVEAELDGLQVLEIRVPGGVRRNEFGFRPDAEIERELAADRPGILDVESPAVAVGLVEVAVRARHIVSARGVITVFAAAVVHAVGDEVAVPSEEQDRVFGRRVIILALAHPLSAELPGVLAAQVEEVGQVARNAVLLVDVLVDDHGVGAGIVHVAGGLLVGRGNVEQACVARPEISAGRFGQELEAGLVRGHDQLLVPVGLEVAPAEGQHDGVPERHVGDRRSREVGIAEPVVVKGLRGIRIPPDVRKIALVLVEVVDDRGAEAQLAENLGGQLGAEIIIGLIPLPRPDGLAVGQIVGDRAVVVIEDRQERAEEPEPVLENVAAQASAALEGPVFVLPVLVIVGVIGGFGVVQEVQLEGVAIVASQLGAAVIAQQFAVEGVSAGARNDAEHAAQRASELGLVAGCPHLDFVDELERGILAAVTVNDVGDVGAVDVVHVLQAGGPVNGCSAQHAFVGNAGKGGDQRFEVAASGKGRENILGYRHAPDRALDVDQRALSDNGHGFLDRSRLHGDVQSDGLLQLKQDVLPDKGLESLDRKRDLIDSGGKSQQTIRPVTGGNGRSLAQQLGAGRLDLDTGKRVALVVSDFPLELAGRGALRQSKHAD